MHTLYNTRPWTLHCRVFTTAEVMWSSRHQNELTQLGSLTNRRINDTINDLSLRLCSVVGHSKAVERGPPCTPTPLPPVNRLRRCHIQMLDRGDRKGKRRVCDDRAMIWWCRVLWRQQSSTNDVGRTMACSNYTERPNTHTDTHRANDSASSEWVNDRLVLRRAVV